MALAFRSSHSVEPGANIWSRKDDIDRLAKKFPPALTTAAQPIIPAPALFGPLDDNAISEGDNAGLPDVATCAVHLEFLEAVFIMLKQKIITSNALDRTFDIVPKDVLQTVGRIKTRKPDPSFKKRQEVKWPIYIRLAAARFMLWWAALPQIVPNRAGEEHTQLTIDTLPPLDVLMVWHSFLLNPLKYKAFCEQNVCTERLHLRFPWKHIYISLSQRQTVVHSRPQNISASNQPAISKPDLNFELSPQAAALFTKHVGAPDLFTALSSYATNTSSTKTVLRNLVSTAGETPPHAAFPEILPLIFTDAEWDICNILANNFERQALFAQKMGNRLWLRSPALEGTLSRAIIRYERFMTLFKMHPHTLLVPTLDVDLVWHTAQCSPKVYEKLCLQLAGRTINHNDKLEEPDLKDGFKITTRMYESRFGVEYNACLCWECEGLRSALEEVGVDAHINIAEVVEKVKEEVEFHKAVELARRRGEMLPVKKGASNYPN